LEVAAGSVGLEVAAGSVELGVTGGFVGLEAGAGSVGSEAGAVGAAGSEGTVTVGPGFGGPLGSGFGLGAGDEDGTGAGAGLGFATGVGAETGAVRETGTGREINCGPPLVETDDEWVDDLVETRFPACACFTAGRARRAITTARAAASGGRGTASLSGARTAGFSLTFRRCANGRAGAGAAAVTELECRGWVGGRVVR
jgi:hypothetical protein